MHNLQLVCLVLRAEGWPLQDQLGFHLISIDNYISTHLFPSSENGIDNEIGMDRLKLVKHLLIFVTLFN